MYHVISKQTINGPVYVNETIDKYIDIFFTQTNINWNLPEKTRYTSRRVEARQCQEKDFVGGLLGNSEIQKYYFNGWINFSLICPDLQDGDGFLIKGDSSSLVTESYQFNINRCMKKTKKGEDCHSIENINEWITDVNVEVWNMQKVIDF